MTVDRPHLQPDRGDVRADFEVQWVVLDGIEMRVAIADTNELHRLGLMGVANLGELGGMLFDFGQETRGGFWMKNTRIPLDIGFFDGDGVMVGKLEMVPCEADPCEIYRIEPAYWYALETPTGGLASTVIGESMLTIG